MSPTDAVVRRRASGLTAFVNVVWTLVMSTVVFVAFLIAPIIVLGLAFLVYRVWPSGKGKSKKPLVSTSDELGLIEAGGDRPAYRFGTGG